MPVEWAGADLFGNADYALYRDLLAAACSANDVEIWFWVLLPNHVRPGAYAFDWLGNRYRRFPFELHSPPANTVMPLAEGDGISGDVRYLSWGAIRFVRGALHGGSASLARTA